jgi:ABC-type transporter Mla subunit MlaD
MVHGRQIETQDVAIQDLTPQLRTRLSRVERIVGWFVGLATLLMVAGFAFYVYHTAERKGWLVTKVRYYTLAETASGLGVGDPVKLMGFDVGEITRIDAQPPGDLFNVYVEFTVREPYYGYLWTEGSNARVTSGDFLGNRYIEVTKGVRGVPTHIEWELQECTVDEARGFPDLNQKWLAQEIRQGTLNTVVVAALEESLSVELLDQIEALGVETILITDRRSGKKTISGVWNDLKGKYEPFGKDAGPYWLAPLEYPALTQRLESLVDQAAKALPGILMLTNQISEVLSNSSRLMVNADRMVTGIEPAVSHLTQITAMLTNREGALGEWLIPTNLNHRLEQTLGSADSAISSTETNLVMVAGGLNATLQNLATLTSNLNAQVEANDKILSQVSEAVVSADTLMQGLKRHWLLRSAFKKPETNRVPLFRRIFPRSQK